MKTTRFEPLSMEPELYDVLKECRQRRGFSVSRYVEAKTLLIAKYFRKYKLSGAVVGVSGGVDSAATLALLSYVQKMPESPLKKLYAVSLPYKETNGATNQDEAERRARLVAQSVDVPFFVIDLAKVLNVFSAALTSALQLETNCWADGQAVSYLRTPALYQTATLLGEAGCPSIVCGTTNRDEGAYLGFFGKASDGMVDLQVVSDLHKSEIRAVAQYLKVPEAILNAAPTGDVYDGATHAEMIGAPYDFVELYMLLLEQERVNTVVGGLSTKARENFEALAKRIELMHRYNKHKYLGGNPSVHLDVYPRGVPGGWSDDFFKKDPREGEGRKLVGEFTLSRETVALFKQRATIDVQSSPLGDLNEKGAVYDGVITPEECSALLQEVAREAKIPVGINGYLKDYTAGKDAIGSYRATTYSKDIAQILWDRISPSLAKVRVFDDLSMTDSGSCKVWRAIGINPAMRFIWYEKGGSLIPHYDAGFDFKDSKRHTLVSLIIYLTDGEEGKGGATRFLLDTQRNLPSSERDYRDWTRLAEESEVIIKSTPRAGRVVTFDHRVLHDAEPWSGKNPRVIIRTDVIFERCDKIGCGNVAAKRDALATPAITDPFYLHVQRLGGDLKNAGYLQDKYDLIEEARKMLLVTPVQKIIDNLKEVTSPVVLVSTGGFSPVHNGHLTMMGIAKEEVERQGGTVVGGYLVPDHDEYIKKKCGAEWIPAHERVAWSAEAVKKSSWLMVDPWAASYAPQELNCTSIILRLEKYLAQHVRSLSPIRIVFVCGSDNSGLADAFIRRGGCVIVPRPASAPTSKRSLARYAEGRALSPSRECFEVSSTKIRGGSYAKLPDSIREQVCAFFSQKKEHRKLSLYLRDEQIDGALFGMPLVEEERRAREELMRSLQKGLLDMLNGINLFTSVSVQRFSVGDQLKALSHSGAVKSELTISIDECFKGEYQIGVSRAFNFPGGERQQSLVPRPGTASLSKQIERIPSGEYVLIEDDIATGQTIRAIKSMLPERIKLKKIVALAQYSIASPLNTVEGDVASELSDIGDVRDFIVGSKSGGLVVQLPSGELARAPYMLPYVQLSQRMSIPRVMERRLSRLIWLLNKRLYRKLKKTFRIKDCDEAFKTFARYLGFQDEMPVEDFCQWHVEVLR